VWCGLLALLLADGSGLGTDVVKLFDPQLANVRFIADSSKGIRKISNNLEVVRVVFWP
jgi:hypothetical protein